MLLPIKARSLKTLKHCRQGVWGSEVAAMQRKTTIALVIAAQLLILLLLFIWYMYRIITTFHANES